MVKLWALTLKREFFSFGRGKQGRAGSTERRRGKRELEQLFSCMIYCINLIHIAIDFHQDIPYSYLVVTCTRTAL